MSGRERATRTLGAEPGPRPVSPLYDVMNMLLEKMPWVSPAGWSRSWLVVLLRERSRDWSSNWG